MTNDDDDMTVIFTELFDRRRFEAGRIQMSDEAQTFPRSQMVGQVRARGRGDVSRGAGECRHERDECGRGDESRGPAVRRVRGHRNATKRGYGNRHGGRVNVRDKLALRVKRLPRRRRHVCARSDGNLTDCRDERPPRTRVVINRCHAVHSRPPRPYNLKTVERTLFSNFARFANVYDQTILLNAVGIVHIFVTRFRT